jgi:hypothetical protein
MIVLEVLAASDRLARHSAESGKETPEDVRAFYAIPIGDMLARQQQVYVNLL